MDLIYIGIAVVIVLLIVLIVLMAGVKQASGDKYSRNFEELEKDLRDVKFELENEIKSSRTEMNQMTQTSFRALGEILSDSQKSAAENQDKRLAELKMQLSN